ncbi:MAG: hypothetical protein QF830_07220 [Rhodospirillales bacterium]|jgi:hypothetical protein|nr:hypothetical protein [Rhodospirillales bacterium]
MKRVWHPLFLLGVIFVLGACAGSVVTSQGRAHRPGMPETFDFAAARGEMPTVIIGDPFPGAKAEVTRAVSAALERHYHGAPTRFVARIAADPGTRHRLIVMFDPPKTLPVAALCGDTKALAAPATAGASRVLAVFCERDLVYSEATARGPAPASPDDPALGAMIGAALTALLPSIDPFEDLD